MRLPDRRPVIIVSDRRDLSDVRTMYLPAARQVENLCECSDEVETGSRRKEEANDGIDLILSNR